MKICTICCNCNKNDSSKDFLCCSNMPREIFEAFVKKEIDVSDITKCRNFNKPKVADDS